MTTADIADTWQLAPKQATAIMVAAGNLAMFDANLRPCESSADVWGAMVAVAPAPRWSAQPPKEQGWYWHWNGDADSPPIPTSVLYSGFRDACFVSAGQLGLAEAVFCAEYGGLWLPLVEPKVLGPDDKWA